MSTVQTAHKVSNFRKWSPQLAQRDDLQSDTKANGQASSITNQYWMPNLRIRRLQDALTFL